MFELFRNFTSGIYFARDGGITSDSSTHHSVPKGVGEYKKSFEEATTAKAKLKAYTELYKAMFKTTDTEKFQAMFKLTGELYNKIPNEDQPKVDFFIGETPEFYQVLTGGTEGLPESPADLLKQEKYKFFMDGFKADPIDPEALIGHLEALGEGGFATAPPAVIRQVDKLRELVEGKDDLKRKLKTYLGKSGLGANRLVRDIAPELASQAQQQTALQTGGGDLDGQDTSQAQAAQQGLGLRVLPGAGQQSPSRDPSGLRAGGQGQATGAAAAQGADGRTEAGANAEENKEEVQQQGAQQGENRKQKLVKAAPRAVGGTLLALGMLALVLGGPAAVVLPLILLGSITLAGPEIAKFGEGVGKLLAAIIAPLAATLTGIALGIPALGLGVAGIIEGATRGVLKIGAKILNKIPGVNVGGQDMDWMPKTWGLIESMGIPLSIANVHNAFTSPDAFLPKEAQTAAPAQKPQPQQQKPQPQQQVQSQVPAQGQGAHAQGQEPAAPRAARESGASEPAKPAHQSPLSGLTISASSGQNPALQTERKPTGLDGVTPDAARPATPKVGESQAEQPVSIPGSVDSASKTGVKGIPLAAQAKAVHAAVDVAALGVSQSMQSRDGSPKAPMQGKKPSSSLTILGG